MRITVFVKVTEMLHETIGTVTKCNLLYPHPASRSEFDAQAAVDNRQFFSR